MAIEFVNLGIGIETVNRFFSVFGFPVAYYGLIIGIGMVLGTALSMWDYKNRGFDPDVLLDFAMWGIVIGVIGARIYYVIFAWDFYKDDLMQVFNIRNGGLAIYGGIIAGVLTLLVFAKKRKQSAPSMLDSAGFGLLVGQSMGRWGNFVNCEAFGGYTESLFAMRMNVANVNQGMISADLWNKAITIGNDTFIQVHPTFLYESAWNVCLLVILLLTRKKKAFEGEIFLRYLFGYGLGRFWIEGLRTDSLMLFNTGIAVSQGIAALCVIGSAASILFFRKKAKVNKTEE